MQHTRQQKQGMQEINLYERTQILADKVKDVLVLDITVREMRLYFLILDLCDNPENILNFADKIAEAEKLFARRPVKN